MLGEKEWNESGLLCSQIPAFKHNNTQGVEKPRKKPQTGSRGGRTAVRPIQHGCATLTTGRGGNHG